MLHRLLHAHHIRHFSIHIKQIRLMNSHTAIPTRITHDHGTKIILKSIQRRGSHTSTRAHATNDHRIHAQILQKRTQFRAEKGARMLFDYHVFVCERGEAW